MPSEISMDIVNQDNDLQHQCNHLNQAIFAHYLLHLKHHMNNTASKNALLRQAYMKSIGLFSIVDRAGAGRNNSYSRSVAYCCSGKIYLLSAEQFTRQEVNNMLNLLTQNAGTNSINAPHAVLRNKIESLRKDNW